MPPIDPRIASMSAKDKIGEAMRRSLPMLPGEARATVLSMLQPASLAIIAATLVGWIAAHLFGVGEVVDLILLVGGVLVLGWSAFTGARELYAFADTAIHAHNDQDLTAAAGHFAKAVVILGVATVQAVLMKGSAKAAIARGVPKVQPRILMDEPPPPGNQLRVTRPASIQPGVYGITDPYGVIEVSRDIPLTEQKVVLFHELVHRYFSPRVGPLRKFRAEMAISGYNRSALLKYLEEALAQGYGQLKVNGFSAGFEAYRFPLDNGYTTVAKMSAEGQAIGSIVLGGTIFYVSISQGPIPEHK